MSYVTPSAVLMARKAWPIPRGNKYTQPPLLQRFLGSLAFDDTDCWLWRGSHTNLGYGMCHGFGEKRAHRVAWVMWNGPIPEGMHVLHKCDVRCCVNPDHLFLGTHRDNMRDMAGKGRGKSPGLFGENNPASKLTNAAVNEIRMKYAVGGVSQAALAKQYGVTTMTVNRAINRKSWVEND